MIGIGKLSGAVAVVAAATTFLMVSHNHVVAHGDVTPQAVDTSSLPKLGDEWLEENPWRDPSGEFWQAAIDIGASGYNQNCARCHGLGAVSGGLAPDLRYLSADYDGDEWYLERYQNGMTQNGITKMPAFGELLGQEAAWAIRTYVETRADEDSVAEFTTQLVAYRDELAAGDVSHGRMSEIVAGMDEIAKKVETGSGAPIADSVASQAVSLLKQDGDQTDKVVEILKVGLSAAK